MILIGMFDSPFVRRVAVTMHLLNLSFEHRNWSVADRMTQADITVACVFKFLSDALAVDTEPYPALRALSRTCELLPAFRAVGAEFHAPK